ncbi:uncharacterized protein MONBRDRAFT_25849 [Monosiga brevicollis MX1]|uniref:Ankyrin repeat domain-containing protein n=1 Tax=Monosiga brevicollis TaxID=81824 RepID=A9V0M2_MONBE|nr:uncharacterized protein MONBRDRAFT_25849 [Monosiga brevicollis MX1]EDQ89040.1 predicted protein [Monosiga brevicollis MX1]|eukprot:XP_001746145.1 hypothetical protein [Monosiga brevicollis MX1]
MTMARASLAHGPLSPLVVSQLDINAVDPQGRTPLRLAIVLGHEACVQALLDCGAEIGDVDAEGWSAVHDATCRGNAGLLEQVLNSRNFRLQQDTEDQVSDLLALLRDTPDFEVCPTSPCVLGDTCHLWKIGSNLRFDMTLLGFENMKWVRGQRSVCFSLPQSTDQSSDNEAGANIEVRYIDHDTQSAYIETMEARPPNRQADSKEIRARLNAPVTTTKMSEDVSFQRLKSGIWGFQRNRTESVGPYECSVYGTNHLTLETLTRLEHLPKNHPARQRSSNPISSMMRAAGGQDNSDAEAQEVGCFDALTASQGGGTEAEQVEALETEHAGDHGLSFEEYIATPAARKRLVVGRPREVKRKKQTLNLNMWMSPDFPLSFRNQLLPILDLLAPTNRHVAKLRDFVHLNLPAGFPVKLEVPLYGVLTARTTFENYRALDADVLAGVSTDDLFGVPTGYRQLLAGQAEFGSEDERMLAMALQASMHQGYGADEFEGYFEVNGSLGDEAALQEAILASMGRSSETIQGQPMQPVTEEELIAQAIALSLQESGSNSNSAPPSNPGPAQPADLSSLSEEEQIRLAIERSLNT